MAEERQKTFFSYAREDSAFVLRLVKELRATGADVWLDQLDIGPGKHWDAEVEKALRECPLHVTVLSTAAVNSPNVMDEVSFALEESKEIIPLLHKDCMVPFRLRRLQWVDFRTDYASGFKALGEVLGIKKAPSATAPAPTQPVEQVHETPKSLDTGIQAGTATQIAHTVEQSQHEAETAEVRNQQNVGSTSGALDAPTLDHRKVEPVPIMPEKPRIGLTPAALWTIAVVLVALVLIVWAISTIETPNKSGSSNHEIAPTATPTSAPANPTPNSSQTSGAKARYKRGNQEIAPTATPNPAPANTPPDTSQASDAKTWYKRGESFYVKGQYDQAIQAFTEAIRADTRNADAFFHRGSAYEFKGDYDSAILDYSQTIALQPDHQRAFVDRGTVYDFKGEYQLAIKDFDKALRLDPKDARAF
ncbi:MAG TPA: toll/interleukin-1 receptor domain-containing protein, partial [Candidatus Angelobacter sp.]